MSFCLLAAEQIGNREIAMPFYEQNNLLDLKISTQICIERNDATVVPSDLNVDIKPITNQNDCHMNSKEMQLNACIIAYHPCLQALVTYLFQT